jgi:hypothetical protein
MTAVLRERHHLPAAQEPAQSGLVVAGQALVAGVRSLRHRRQVEQIANRPAQRLRLLLPMRKEAAGIVQSLPPVGEIDVGRAAGLKRRVGATRSASPVILAECSPQRN